MKVAMGPPPSPPQNPNTDSSTEPQIDTTKVPMGPPPPKFTTPPPPPKFTTPPSPPKPDLNPETQNPITQELEPNPNNTHIQESPKQEENQLPQVPKPKPQHIPDSISKESPDIKVPYTIPPWSEPPCHPFFLEVLKDGSIIDNFNVSEKGAYMFGRVDLCDFVLDHPTISRFHAVMQFKQSGEAYIFDLGSTHGTSVNKNQVKKKIYTELHVGDVIRFGHSSRLYVFQGPTELMPPEGDLHKIRSAKMREEILDREASILRAKREASLADGISWGMAEDAIEEAEEDKEEVTWQTYKGQLTERQQKTREKVIKRIEKIANMKKEIDAIRAKDIPQGGLTQGQQTQIARNEQRTAQIFEELESLEETLNESIQESIGARTGKVRSKKKGIIMEDEDEAPSDDDEFYDRTKKPTTQKAGEQRSVETADSLLDKKDAIMKEIEQKQILINEKNASVPQVEGVTEAGDPLDAYMTGLSTKIVLDSAAQLQKDMASLQTELDRILYLLKIADPTGEAARKRELEVKESTSGEAVTSTSEITKHLPAERKKKPGPAKPTHDSTSQKGTPDDVIPAAMVTEPDKTVNVSKEVTSVYMVKKPQWLGAIHDSEMKEAQHQEAPLEMHDSDQFVDYKDRKEALGSVVDVQVESGIESAAPGLIIRKRKQVETSRVSDDETPQVSTSSSAEAETAAEDAMALLLKHKKGFLVSDEEGNGGILHNDQTRNDKTKSRRVLGPEKPDFLNNNPDYEAWVPPKGQSGDGRTSLNDRFGY